MKLPDEPAPNALALWFFSAWVFVSRRPFDTAARKQGPRHHPLQGRPAVRRLCDGLIRHIPGLRILPRAAAVEADTRIPRRIWAYWHDGEVQANPLVRACLASWREQNPAWEFRCLDRASPEMRTVQKRLPEGLGIAHQSDVLRLALLAEYGGVWVDASAWCLAPLDSWLPRHAGFFAFHYPANTADRLLANWFLAAGRGDAIISAWRDTCLAYWHARSRPEHYFVHHYLFFWLIATQPESRRVWASKRTLPAAPQHLVQHALKGLMPRDRAFAALRDAPQQSPVQKLDWRMADDLPEITDILRTAGRLPTEH